MVLVLDEASEAHQFVTPRNLGRQYDFLQMAFIVSQMTPDFPVDRRFVCELNFYAVQYLSSQPGEYRRANVEIRHSRHDPPRWQDVEGLMDDFMIRFARMFKEADPIEFAAYVLWRINWIHPFMQGNGRTARALSYFVLCKRFDFWLPGARIIPEQIRETRQEYCDLLTEADSSATKEGDANLSSMQAYLSRLLAVQLS